MPSYPVVMLFPEWPFTEIQEITGYNAHNVAPFKVEQTGVVPGSADDDSVSVFADTYGRFIVCYRDESKVERFVSQPVRMVPNCVWKDGAPYSTGLPYLFMLTYQNQTGPFEISINGQSIASNESVGGAVLDIQALSPPPPSEPPLAPSDEKPIAIIRFDLPPSIVADEGLGNQNPSEEK